MKRLATRNAYTQRIDRVMRTIHANLDADLDLQGLADVACLSPYHFHRIYHAVTGETVSATLSRLRLHRAAVALARTKRPFGVIAREAGFGSAAAFSRAFRDAYGKAPSHFRAVVRSQGRTVMPEIAIRMLPDMHLIVTEHRGLPSRIGEAFDRLVAWCAPQGLLNTTRLGVAIYLTDMRLPEADLRALAGFAVESTVLPPDPLFFAHILPGGRHAVALHKGPYARLGETWNALYAWIAGNGEQLAHRPPFEVNLNNPRDTAPEDLLTEVCVPLL